MNNVLPIVIKDIGRRKYDSRKYFGLVRVWLAKKYLFLLYVIQRLPNQWHKFSARMFWGLNNNHTFALPRMLFLTQCGMEK